MCEPATIIAVASAAVSAKGAYDQSKSAKDMANYNAQVADVQARDARTRGDEEAAKVRRQNAQLAGSQRAGFAAKGIDFSDGSAGDALDQTDFFSQVDQNTARDNAAKEAWSLKAKKRGYEFEAASQNPGQAAGVSLLGNAASVSSKWSAYKKVS